LIIKLSGGFRYRSTHPTLANDSDKIEEGYLQGRFGAIPVLGKLDTLFE
jgi:hypothetical protein